MLKNIGDHQIPENFQHRHGSQTSNDYEDFAASDSMMPSESNNQLSKAPGNQDYQAENLDKSANSCSEDDIEQKVQSLLSIALDRSQSGSFTSLNESKNLIMREVISTQQINSETGLTKRQKCRQCEEVFLSKEDLWEHLKSHCPDERRLTCPICSFVTGFRHHLEYHLRNHFGSKPFRCNECPYTCVNRSMLNSHLRTHSSQRPFSCEHCHYRTKYRQSLRQHIAAHGHYPINPMMINQNKKNEVSPTYSPFYNRHSMYSTFRTSASDAEQSLSGNDNCVSSIPSLGFHSSGSLDAILGTIISTVTSMEEMISKNNQSESDDDYDIDVGGPSDLDNSNLIKMTSPPTPEMLECNHCGILFARLEIYQFHMSCHSSLDPFRCSLCDRKCNGVLQFFKHLLKTEHH